MTKKIIILSFILFVCFSFSIYCSELNVSLSELEKYVGELIPKNAQRIDMNMWRIKIYEDDNITQEIILRTKDNTVITAEYNFNAITNNLLITLRGFYIDNLEKYGEFVSDNNGVLFWKTNSDNLTKRPINVALSKVIHNNELGSFYFIVAVRLLNN